MQIPINMDTACIPILELLVSVIDELIDSLKVYIGKIITIQFKLPAIAPTPVSEF